MDRERILKKVGKMRVLVDRKELTRESLKKLREDRKRSGLRRGKKKKAKDE